MQDTTFISRMLSGFMIGLALLFSACEDLISLDLNEADSRLVIVAEISNREKTHEVSIHQTVPVGSDSLSSPVSGAQVSVMDRRGQMLVFNEVMPGLYRSRVFRGSYGMDYRLSVKVGPDEYTAVSTIPAFVPVDSVGTVSSTFMGEENRHVAFKFIDPPGVANYYRYTLSLDAGPYRYMGVFEDKYNDRRWVSHELYNPDIKLKAGDRVRVQRQCIDQASFRYWRSFSIANPAASAPANPSSNINGGALGYFSAYSMNEYDIEIR